MSLPLKIDLLLKKNPNRTFHLPTIHFQSEDVSFGEVCHWLPNLVSTKNLHHSNITIHHPPSPPAFLARLQRFSTPKSVAFLEAPKILSPKCPSAASKRWVRRVPQIGRWVLLPQKTLENTRKKDLWKNGLVWGCLGCFYNGNLRGPPRQCQTPKK